MTLVPLWRYTHIIHDIPCTPTDAEYFASWDSWTARKEASGMLMGHFFMKVGFYASSLRHFVFWISALYLDILDPICIYFFLPQRPCHDYRYPLLNQASHHSSWSYPIPISSIFLLTPHTPSLPDFCWPVVHHHITDP